MKYLSIDIETYSSVDISKAGLYKYVQSFDFAILLFAYSVDGGPVQIVDLAQGEEIPPDIIAALGDINVTKYAYNAAFEQYCLSKYYTTPIYQWRCTMVQGLYCGYPAGLSAIGESSPPVKHSYDTFVYHVNPQKLTVVEHAISRTMSLKNGSFLRSIVSRTL